MNEDLLCQQLADSLSPLFHCTVAPRGSVRVRTPLLFPDGGVIDVFVQGLGEPYTVTDYGDAAGWLSLQTVSQQRTTRQRELIEDTCQTLGIELNGGQMVLREVLAGGLAEAVLRMAQAEARVADIWFTLRQLPGESAADDVEEWLRNKMLKAERRVPLLGRSYRQWYVDFRTITPERESLVFFLSTGTRGAARRLVEHVVAGCFDLSGLRSSNPKIGFVSLFDDRFDVWRDEDFNLAQEQSEVAYWSHPDKLELILTTAPNGEALV